MDWKKFLRPKEKKAATKSSDGPLPPGFSGKLHPIVALDISSMAVKLLELGRKGKKLVVESYAVEPLPQNAVVEKRINDVEAVGEAIRRAVKRAKTRTKDCALAVPGSAIISKQISVPSTPSESELASQIELEAEKHIPFPVDEINYDFQVIGPSEKDPERTDILLIASRTENVDARADAADIAGLKPRVMDVESFALGHACHLLKHDFPNGGEDKTIAIIDVGATMTVMNVLHDMESVYTREQQFGGKQLTEDIMRHFGLSHEEAGRAKRAGDLPSNYVPEVLDPFRQNMSQQINRGLQYFLTSSDFNQIDQIVLAGGCASIPGIAQMIEGEMAIPTLVSNPFEGMTIASKVNSERLRMDSSAYMIACGLGLRSFD